MDKIVKQKKAYLLALTAVLFWSTISSAFKITLRYMPFEELVLWSVINGVVILFLINLSGKARINFISLKPKEYFNSAVMGLFNPFFYYLVLIKAYSLLEAQVAGTLNYIWPIVLVLLSIPMLKQKITSRALIAITISFLGIIIISTKGNPLALEFSNGMGVLLALSSAVFWALYWIINMKDDREESGKILLNMIFGLLFLILYFVLTGKSFNLPSINGFLGTLYIGIFEMSITFVIWLKALNLSSDTAKVSNLIYLSPFLGLFWINHAVGEKIHMYTIVGLVFIIGGIVFQNKIKSSS
jgi:drug/metabolite transporter (DMT)-like permease